MNCNAVVPWFGTKSTIAGDIISQLGPHHAYWEPCCGSLSVLFAKSPSTYETVNDLHGDLVNLIWVLQSPRCLELYDRCRRVLVSESIFAYACQRIGKTQWRPSNPPTDEDLERAYWFFVRSWWGRNGVAGLTRFGTLSVRYRARGGNSGASFHARVEAMPEWHDRLRNVQVLHRDAFKMLEAIEDKAGVAIYVDPPYLGIRGHHYVHDFAAEDHRRLAAALARFRHARVVLSYYDHPTLAELYPGWDRAAPAKTRQLSRGHRSADARPATAPEVLLVNGPLFGPSPVRPQIVAG